MKLAIVLSFFLVEDLMFPPPAALDFRGLLSSLLLLFLPRELFVGCPPEYPLMLVPNGRCFKLFPLGFAFSPRLRLPALMLLDCVRLEADLPRTFAFCLGCSDLFRRDCWPGCLFEYTLAGPRDN